MRGIEKEIIVDLRDFDKDILTAALEAGVKRVILEKGRSAQAHNLGRITVISEDGDEIPGKDIHFEEITSKEDEDRILKNKGDIFILAKDWKIIPLENLVSRSDRIFAFGEADEIPMLFGVLERGVRGVIIKPKSPSEIRKALALANRKGDKIPLVEAVVTKVVDVGMGERSCIDTCSIMKEGEGMLVGSTSNFMFLIHAESIKTEYCATRPFRVNAGAIHSYALLEGNKTKYLQEVSPGDKVMVLSADGSARSAIVGRNKIEERPLLLLEAQAEGRKASVILQNAETIRLVIPGGAYVSVSKIKPGDKVLVKTDSVGRHFGQAIREMIRE